MHHIVLDQWSRGASFLHRRDPRAKIAVLLAYLAAAATARRVAPACVILALLGLGALGSARIPLRAAALRAAVVLPFTLIFAVILWISGDPGRAAALVARSYVSALGVVTLAATTPLPSLFRGLESLRAPVFLLNVAQFLYRYLFVISEEAQHMAKAAAVRGASAGGLAMRRLRFRAAAGALGVLFARSYLRAEDVHRAMLARGFTGRLRTLNAPRFGGADLAFLIAGCAAPVVVRFALERMA